jgi:hypothetical protein
MSLSEHLSRAAARRAAGGQPASPTLAPPADIVIDLTTTQGERSSVVLDLTHAPELGPVSTAGRAQSYEHLSLFSPDNQIRAVARTLHRLTIEASAEVPAAPTRTRSVEDRPTQAEARHAATPLAVTASTLARLRALAESQAAHATQASTLPPPPPPPPPSPTDGVVRIAEIPEAFVPRWSTVPVAIPPSSKRRLATLRRKPLAPVRVPTCPACGHTARIDIADRTTGRLHLSCPYCFRMWQAVTTPTSEQHDSVRLQG